MPDPADPPAVAAATAGGPPPSPEAVRAPDGAGGPAAWAGPVDGGLTLWRSHWAAMVAHCLRAFPEEGCGLLGGDPDTGVVATCYPTANAAASARVYTVEPSDHLRADRAAEAAGESIIGVFHSHTHTDAFPSETDIRQAPDPTWHYVLVSLRDSHPVVRSYRIIDGTVTEEPVRIGEAGGHAVGR